MRSLITKISLSFGKETTSFQPVNIHNIFSDFFNIKTRDSRLGQIDKVISLIIKLQKKTKNKQMIENKKIFTSFFGRSNLDFNKKGQIWPFYTEWTQFGIQLFLSNKFGIFKQIYQRDNQVKNNKNNGEEKDRYLIRVVTKKDKQELYKLYIQHFSTRSPLRVAMYKKYPEKKHYDESYWNVVKAYYVQEIFGKGLCVGCFDTHNNNEIVGATLVKDLWFHRQDLMKGNQMIGAFAHVKQQLGRQMLPEDYAIFQEGKHGILEHWLYVMKQEHSGKGLMLKMAALSDHLAQKKGYQYSASWASNFKTHIIFKQLGYRNVAEVNARKIQINGEKYFEDVQEEQNASIIWLKKLAKPEKQA